ncbi:FadR/GntR family transcriptional regulator [Phytoactinopolyspora endophytica]|uniref:FadR/GntR family transcriptional regulator n=1 Tax=Phytoactinopolyspora endophytica TaxID=1642495 RepID=UPI00101E0C87|nr:FadR/GntR family transcriptional regulator [Phytoactinopolyspora endophytica]
MRVVRTTLAEQVASELVERIERMALRPGDPIPPESQLAEDFGVNRLVVREAIRMLAAREILVSSQGRQARVSTPSARVLAQMLDFRVRQESLSLEDVIQTRRLVECEVARLAARRVRSGEAGVTETAALLEAMSGAVDDRDKFVDLDVKFHAAISEAAGAELLRLILTSFETILLRARRSTYDARAARGEGHEVTLRAHRSILAAIEAGDEQGAAAAMEEHLQETKRDIPPQ